MANRFLKSLAGSIGLFLFIACLGLPLGQNSYGTAVMAAAGAANAKPITTRDEIVNVCVNPYLTHQTIDGFGGSVTWYNNWLTENPYSEAVYNLLFKEAGLNILRIKNNYGYSKPGEINNVANDLKVITGANKAAGKRVTVLMSSWSPAAYLKSNRTIVGGGSLKKDASGKYMYAELGQYFYDAVKAYNAKGVPLDYLSIQNEPDFKASYDGCEFEGTETDTMAAYSKAFSAVYDKLKELPNPPKMFGPDSMNVDFVQISKYIQPLMAENPRQLYGIAHHLYAGGTHENPDTYIKSMNKLKKAYPDLPKWQTEFSRGNGIQCAWTINTTMVEEDANAYLLWDLVWTETGSTIAMENPAARASWKTPQGYTIKDAYYAIKHFSKFVEPGYKRIDAAADGTASDIKTSAYTSPEQDALTIVLINTKYANSKVRLELNGYQATSSEIYLSNFQLDSKARFVAKGSLGDDRIVELPAQSVATVVLRGKPGVKPALIKTALPAPTSAEEKTRAIQGTPVIDGAMDQIWQNAVEVSPARIAHGDHGASAKFRTMWDENYLYVYAEVADPTPDVSNRAVYLQDSVEVFVNEDNQKPADYGSGDGQYRVNSGNRQSFGDSTAKEGFKSAAKKTATGYIIEMAIPFRTISGAAGKTVGFDFQVNDAQGGDRAWILKWSDPSNETYHDLEDIGRVTMAAKTAAEAK